MSKLRVIGIGNPLMGDDGVGIALVEELRRLELPAAIEVLDGGTGGLSLLALMEGAREVLVIDAVAMGRPPGTLAVFSLEELLPEPDSSPLSLHAEGPLPALLLGRELGLLPPLTLFAIQPDRVAPGLGLSPAVTRALPELLAALRAYLEVPR